MAADLLVHIKLSSSFEGKYHPGPYQVDALANCSAANEPAPLALTHDFVEISVIIAVVLAAPDPKAVLVQTVEGEQPQSVAQ